MSRMCIRPNTCTDQRKKFAVCFPVKVTKHVTLRGYPVHLIFGHISRISLDLLTSFSKQVNKTLRFSDRHIARQTTCKLSDRRTGKLLWSNYIKLLGKLSVDNADNFGRVLSSGSLRPEETKTTLQTCDYGVSHGKLINLWFLLCEFRAQTLHARIQAIQS